MRVNSGSSWIFDLGADIYAWFTANAAWRQSSARLAAHLPQADRIRVVDLGCGPGVSTFELARQRPDARLVGLDVAARMLAQARLRERHHRATDGLPAAGRIAWVRGDARRLPFGTATVDALTGHSFLYLLPDRTAALAEMRRVLRPGGRVVLMEPSARPASPRQVLGVSRDMRLLVSVTLWRPMSRLHGRFTPASLRHTLEQAGFVDCRVEEVLSGLGLVARAERA